LPPLTILSVPRTLASPGQRLQLARWENVPKRTRSPFSSSCSPYSRHLERTRCSDGDDTITTFTPIRFPLSAVRCSPVRLFFFFVSFDETSSPVQGSSGCYSLHRAPFPNEMAYSIFPTSLGSLLLGALSRRSTDVHYAPIHLHLGKNGRNR
jgi:hypothetical protein